MIDEPDVDTWAEINLRLRLAEHALNRLDLPTAHIHIRWARHWHQALAPGEQPLT